MKTEPRDIQSAAATAAASTAMTAVTTASYAAPSNEEGGSEGGGQLALDEDYAEDNYDYGEYDGDGGGGLYGDDSGLMDPNTGLPIPAGSDGNKGRGKSIFEMSDEEHHECVRLVITVHNKGKILLPKRVTVVPYLRKIYNRLVPVP